ncbi:unnamed protein product [Musa banksii]
MQFPHDEDKYIDQLASVIPIGNGTIRTCIRHWRRGMSFAPSDSHEAQAYLFHTRIRCSCSCRCFWIN